MGEGRGLRVGVNARAEAGLVAAAREALALAGLDLLARIGRTEAGLVAVAEAAVIVLAGGLDFLARIGVDLRAGLAAVIAEAVAGIALRAGLDLLAVVGLDVLRTEHAVGVVRIARGGIAIGRDRLAGEAAAAVAGAAFDIVALLRLGLVGLAGRVAAAIDIQLAAGAEIVAGRVLAADGRVEAAVGGVAVEIAAVGRAAVDIQLLVAAVGDVQRLGQADIARDIAAADVGIDARRLDAGTERAAGVGVDVLVPRNVDLADVVDLRQLGNTVAGQVRDSVFRVGTMPCAELGKPVGFRRHRLCNHAGGHQRGGQIHQGLRGFLRGHRTNPSPLGA